MEVFADFKKGISLCTKMKKGSDFIEFQVENEYPGSYYIGYHN
jgi:hypothetical protein